MTSLEELAARWPVDRVAAGVTNADGTLWTMGAVDWAPRIASVSKLFVGMCALIAMEELSITLDDEAGPPGSTVRHLLAHASGLAFDDDVVLAPPATRRIYSNTGIERFAEHLAAATGIAFGEYLRLGVIEPLELEATSLRGSPAGSMHGSITDLLTFGRELLAPTLVSGETMRMATEAHFPDLDGVVPELGRYSPCPWGLTFELKHDKAPHWTGLTNAWETFGHFGGTGSFLWVDPAAGLACTALTDTEFGPWAMEHWPTFNDAVVARYA